MKNFDNMKIEHRFLDMCTTDGREAATAEVIFNKMDSVLVKHGIPWKNCVSLSVDNTSVIWVFGMHNIIRLILIRINPLLPKSHYIGL